MLDDALRFGAVTVVLGEKSGKYPDGNQVLVQGAAGMHGHELHAAADAQDRQVGVQRGGEQGELRGVALGTQPRCLGVRRGAVAGGVDVGAAGDE